MTEREMTKRFRLAATSERNEPKIRDKDNAGHRPPPPKAVTRPAPNLAPPGSVGIKRASQIGPGIRTKPAKRFRLGEGSELADTFSPIARPGTDRSRDRG